MPIFEYVCGKCESDFEELVRSDTIVACPECGSKQVEKKLSVFAAGSSSKDGEPPPCFTGESGCSLGKCGSGRCGIA